MSRGTALIEAYGEEPPEKNVLLVAISRPLQIVRFMQMQTKTWVDCNRLDRAPNKAQKNTLAI